MLSWFGIIQISFLTCFKISKRSIHQIGLVVNGVQPNSLENFMSVISDRLRELRGTQSQAEMAAPLGIKYQQWAKYERGESAPGAELLIRICKAHACSSDWLLGLKDGSSSAVASAPGAIAVVGSHNSFGVPGESAACTKCPYKKKLKALEKLISK